MSFHSPLTIDLDEATSNDGSELIESEPSSSIINHSTASSSEEDMHEADEEIIDPSPTSITPSIDAVLVAPYHHQQPNDDTHIMIHDRLRRSKFTSSSFHERRERRRRSRQNRETGHQHTNQNENDANAKSIPFAVKMSLVNFLVIALVILVGTLRQETGDDLTAAAAPSFTFIHSTQPSPFIQSFSTLQLNQVDHLQSEHHHPLLLSYSRMIEFDANTTTNSTVADINYCAAAHTFPHSPLASSLKQGSFLIPLIGLIWFLVGLGQLQLRYLQPWARWFSNVRGFSSREGESLCLGLIGILPQFAIHTIALLWTNRDMGLGAVLGATISNLFIITSATPYLLATVAPAVTFTLFWFRAARDSFAFCLGLLFVVSVTIAGNEITYVSTIPIVVALLLYCILWYYSWPIYQWVGRGVNHATVILNSVDPELNQNIALINFLEGNIFSAFINLIICMSVSAVIWDELTGPSWLVSVNYGFSSIFILECLVKHFAYGIFGYWKEPLNAFDGVLVVLIIFEFIFSSGNIASSVRVVRLFRFLRALRGMRAVRVARGISFRNGTFHFTRHTSRKSKTIAEQSGTESKGNELSRLSNGPTAPLSATTSVGAATGLLVLGSTSGTPGDSTTPKSTHQARIDEAKARINGEDIDDEHSISRSQSQIDPALLNMYGGGPGGGGGQLSPFHSGSGDRKFSAIQDSTNLTVAMTAAAPNPQNNRSPRERLSRSFSFNTIGAITSGGGGGTSNNLSSSPASGVGGGPGVRRSFSGMNRPSSRHHRTSSEHIRRDSVIAEEPDLQAHPVDNAPNLTVSTTLPSTFITPIKPVGGFVRFTGTVLSPIMASPGSIDFADDSTPISLPTPLGSPSIEHQQAGDERDENMVGPGVFASNITPRSRLMSRTHSFNMSSRNPLQTPPSIFQPIVDGGANNLSTGGKASPTLTFVPAPSTPSRPIPGRGPIGVSPLSELSLSPPATGASHSPPTISTPTSEEVVFVPAPPSAARIPGRRGPITISSPMLSPSNLSPVNTPKTPVEEVKSNTPITIIGEPTTAIAPSSSPAPVATTNPNPTHKTTTSRDRIQIRRGTGNGSSPSTPTKTIASSHTTTKSMDTNAIPTAITVPAVPIVAPVPESATTVAASPAASPVVIAPSGKPKKQLFVLTPRLPTSLGSTAQFKSPGDVEAELDGLDLIKAQRNEAVLKAQYDALHGGNETEKSSNTIHIQPGSRLLLQNRLHHVEHEEADRQKAVASSSPPAAVASPSMSSPVEPFSGVASPSITSPVVASPPTVPTNILRSRALERIAPLQIPSPSGESIKAASTTTGSDGEPPLTRTFTSDSRYSPNDDSPRTPELRPRPASRFASVPRTNSLQLATAPVSELVTMSLPTSPASPPLPPTAVAPAPTGGSSKRFAPPVPIGGTDSSNYYMAALGLRPNQPNFMGSPLSPLSEPMSAGLPGSGGLDSVSRRASRRTSLNSMNRSATFQPRARHKFSAKKAARLLGVYELEEGIEPTSAPSATQPVHRVSTHTHHHHHHHRGSNRVSDLSQEDENKPPSTHRAKSNRDSHRASSGGPRRSSTQVASPSSGGVGGSVLTALDGASGGSPLQNVHTASTDRESPSHPALGAASSGSNVASAMLDDGAEYSRGSMHSDSEYSSVGSWDSYSDGGSEFGGDSSAPSDSGWDSDATSSEDENDASGASAPNRRFRRKHIRAWSVVPKKYFHWRSTIAAVCLLIMSAIVITGIVLNVMDAINPPSN